MSESQEKRLLVVYTGNGKGKTSAALGMCVRAIGYDWHICLIQFVKGSFEYGELGGIKRLSSNVELHVMGEGYVGIMGDDKDFEEHRSAARNGITLALEKVKTGKYQLIILDELNIALDLGLVMREEVEAVLETRGEMQHLVITGRGAPDWLYAEADIVTDMTEIKHPFQKGIPGQKGIDW